MFEKLKIENILNKVSPEHQNIFIVRTDGIGDYVLFRNFLEILKKHPKLNGYNIILCGNIIWRNLAETYDKDFVDEFIWIDRIKFFEDREYRHNFYDRIKKIKCKLAINPIFSRDYLSNTIIKILNADYKIGSIGDESNMTKAEKTLADSYYTELIAAQKDNLFEFYRNKEFFEKLLQEKIKLKKPFINVDKFFSNSNFSSEEFVVIFPDAGYEFRQWSIENYAEIANYIFKKFGLKIVVAGGKKFKNKGKELISKIIDDAVVNIIGLRTLKEVAEILSKAKLLISGDTGIFHIAAAVKTKIICISNGNTYGRFVPYPKKITDKVFVVFPPEIQNKQEDIEYLNNKYRYFSELNINDITVKSIKSIINVII